ncbi:SLAC1 anion channel family protein [Castellaniella sp.]|uniref:SLAC1 anion channel family protein n=1 Tax=Castellaniella sp. TaxID=1955812 RepID=UPI003560C34F
MNTLHTTPAGQPSRVQAAGWLQHFPIALFASVLGLAGLSIAWMKAQHVLGAPALVSEAIRGFATVVWFTLLGLYLVKWARFPAAVEEERSHPVKLNFFAAISIGLLLLAIVWTPSAPRLAYWMWVAGAVAHLLFTLMTISVWLFRPPFQIQHLTAAWFIPTVGNIIVPIAGVQYAPADISWFFFSVGIVFWLILMTVLFYRLFFHESLPGKLQPTLFILIAPPAVGYLAYIALGGSGVDAFARILYFTALFLTLLLAIQIRRFLRIPFFLSAWGYSFPLAAITIATLEMGAQSGLAFYRLLGSGLLAIASAVIALLLVKTVQALVLGRVFVPD